jgi:phage terminase small subunit
MRDIKKHEREKLSKRVSIKKARRITMRQKVFAKLLPISKDATQAAIDAGYSEISARQIAVENMSKPSIIALVEKNMKQCMNDSGLTNDNLAAKFHELIYYNSEKVIRVVGEGLNAREVEEMRDARVAASTLANVVKFKGASLENTATNIISDVNADTAWLAIKSLVRKLSVEQVKELRDSCDAMLESKSKIISES